MNGELSCPVHRGACARRQRIGAEYPRFAGIECQPRAMRTAPPFCESNGLVLYPAPSQLFDRSQERNALRWRCILRAIKSMTPYRPEPTVAKYSARDPPPEQVAAKQPAN